MHKLYQIAAPQRSRRGARATLPAGARRDTGVTLGGAGGGHVKRRSIILRRHTQGVRLKVLFGLIGAFVGAVLGGVSSILALAVFGALVGWRWTALLGGKAAPASDIDAPTLLRRIVALEKEVAALRGSGSAAPAPSASAKATDAAPAIVAVAPAPAADPFASPAPEPVVARVVPPEDMPPAPRAAPGARPAEVAKLAVAAVVAPPPPRPVAPPPPPAVPLRDRLPPFVARAIFGGNTIVKIGVLILFLGLAFLLRYTAERVTVPVEFRYAGVALIGAALTAIGWRLRDRLDAAGGTGYGLILQGAGIGVFYLTTLGALRLNPLLSPELAFAFMALVAVLGAILAVLQDAPWLALVAVAEGFAAPVLVSTGSGAYVPLMSYMMILDGGILAMAWFKAWRPLNLVGAVATFTLAGAWAHEHYTAADYAGVQAFLLLFFLLFTLTGVLFARRALAAGDGPPADAPMAERAVDALRLVGRVDSTLTFGVPLAAFSLQYLLVRDMPWGPPWAAAAFALFHILLGGALMRSRLPRYALLGEAHVIVGVIFGTLAVPLALQQGAWTGATWAIEAAGMYWLGARQRRTYARAFALTVMGGAALKLVAGMSVNLADGVPLLVGSTLGMGMLAVALGAVDVVRRHIADAQRSAVEDVAAASVPFAAALALTALAWMLCPLLWAAAITAWIAFGCAAFAGRLAAPSLRVASALLHLVALSAMGVSLQVSSEAATQVHAWQDLVAALLIGVALLATGWLGLRDAWREAAQGQPRPIPIGSSIGLVLGLAAASMSLLFELAPADAALAWPVIGLAAAFIGVRLRSDALIGSGFALQLAAGVASLAYESVWQYVPAGVAIASTLWIPLLLTTTGLLLGDWLRAAAAGERRAWWHATPTQWIVIAWSLAWWSRTLPPLVWHSLQAAIPGPGTFDVWPHWQLIWVTLTAVAAVALARWRDWRVLGQATLATVPVWIAMAFVESNSVAPSANLGWLAWPLAFAAHPLLARQQARWRPALATAPLNIAGGWLFVALATRECVMRVQANAAPDSAWIALAAMLAPALVIIASAQPALLRRFRDEAQAIAWRVAGCGALALYLFGWLWFGNLGAGDAAPLPYVPLLNPLEIGQGIALLALLVWVRALPAAWRDRVPPLALPALAGVTAFGLVTGLVLRTCHHWAGIAWSADALYDSTLAQAALSVTWSLIGVALMVAGHRGGRRVVWSVGAALLGVVVAKLFLVELADRGTVSRIVSFMVVGALMLAVGYFAPIPPRRPDAEPALPDVPGETA
jgi:uncharacterized membrane protein